MVKPQVTIIGLGLIGGSIGLGLISSTKQLHVVGHDIDPSRGRLAKKMGAVHDSRLNLIDACQDADLVIISTPITAIRETLELIGPTLKRGCVITDTASLKAPVLAWAAEALPANVPFVGGDPLLNPNAEFDEAAAKQGLDQARADLLQNALFALCPATDTPPTAVKRVSDMINLLQARPFYIDAIEHDGMRAAVAGLPVLTGLALMRELSGAPGWQEARKLADHFLGMTTVCLAEDAQDQQAQLLLNADHLVPRLDALIQQLEELRAWLATKNTPALEEAFDQAVFSRTQWLTDRAKADWGEELAEFGVTGTLGSLGNMFGLGSRQRKPKEDR
jgi:prephenate dehydrogenase